MTGGVDGAGVVAGGDAQPVLINLWSSPRNISTALMYSWRQRPDTVVYDEPLYAHYLRVTGVEHPGRDEVLATQDNDGRRVVDELILGDHDRPIALFKQMAKHLIDLDRSFLGRCRNVLLTRDPYEMLTSFQKQVPDATLAETGFVELVEILDATVASGGQPIVVEAKALLRSPERVLTELCSRLGVPFDPGMLSWPPGPKPEDGAWAPYWYETAHRSTGWQPWSPKDDVLLPSLEPVLDQASALYQRLLPYALS